MLLSTLAVVQGTLWAPHLFLSLGSHSLPFTCCALVQDRAEQEAEPAVEDVPAGQFEQDAAAVLEYWLASQLVQVDEPARAKVPAVQAVHAPLFRR